MMLVSTYTLGFIVLALVQESYRRERNAINIRARVYCPENGFESNCGSEQTPTIRCRGQQHGSVCPTAVTTA
ncbi:MAG: hypothetical protein ACT4QD_10870 [Acidobacteriota bacterium]